MNELTNDATSTFFSFVDKKEVAIETRLTLSKKSAHVIVTKDQFHQRSTCSFYVRKLRSQLFCAYILGLYFTVVSLPAQKLRVER
jgi:hypothetical protein